MKQNLSEWAKSVKIELIRRGWDLGDLAEAVGMSRGYISAIVNERARAEPVSRAISEVLGIRDAAHSSL